MFENGALSFYLNQGTFLRGHGEDMGGEVSSRPTLLCPDLPHMEAASLSEVLDCPGRQESLREHPFLTAHVIDKNRSEKSSD